MHIKCNDEPAYTAVTTYEECLKEKENLKVSDRWLIIGVTTLVLVFCIISVAYGAYVWRRERQKIDKSTKRTEPVVVFENRSINESWISQIF